MFRESQKYTQKCKKKVPQVSYKCATGEPTVVKAEPQKKCKKVIKVSNQCARGELKCTVGYIAGEI